eukprot:scaffold132552_cov30-Tisochrysis_lutea.AAC.1
MQINSIMYIDLSASFMYIDLHTYVHDPTLLSLTFIKNPERVHAHSQGCDELRTAAEGALRVLAWTLRSPWVLPGGGAWQGLVAARIRAKARALQRRRRHVKVCRVAAVCSGEGVKERRHIKVRRVPAVRSVQ